MEHIAVLGSTGSIGKNALRIVENHPKLFRIRALAAGRNADLLYRQAVKFKPEMVCLYDKERAVTLEKKLKPLRIKVLTGDEGLMRASTLPSVTRVIFSMVGACGLLPIFAALRAKKVIAVANKEPLVMAGELLIREARRLKVPVFPIDSEHSGLWQCLEGKHPDTIRKLIITSSGGPFRNRQGSFSRVTAAEALRHPRWKMGPKITIDSATMMNKGLEVIEAANLFSVSADKVEVLIHPEAIVHALVEFTDGSQLAHLGITDMRLPIQYAMSYPERLESSLPALDLCALQRLHFEKPKLTKFPCLKLGYESIRIGGTMPAALNAANEIAVEAFLNSRISFLGIPRTIEKVMQKHRVRKNPELAEIMEADQWAREEARVLIQSKRSR